MAKLPSFTDGDRFYAADTCDPLRIAAEKGELAFKSFASGQYPGMRFPPGVLPGLKSVGYWNATKDQHWGLDWHRNEGIEVSFLLSGKLVYWTSSSFWDISAGKSFVSLPWQIHRIGNPNIDSSKLIWFIIDSNIRNKNHVYKWPNWIVLAKEDLENLLSLLLYRESPVLSYPQKMAQAWENLYRLIRDTKDGCPISGIAVMINEILYQLVRLLRENQTSLAFQDETSLNPALRTVQLFFEDLNAVSGQLAYPWSIKEMARTCQMGTTHFTKCCYQLTNLSPIHMLNRQRIVLAEQMMKMSPELSVTDIAFACGFSSSQYFATVFKKWTGKTPSEYRRISSFNFEK